MKRSFANKRQLIATALMMVSGLVLTKFAHAVGETPFDAHSTAVEDSSTETPTLTFTEDDPFGPFIDRSNDVRFAEHPQLSSELPPLTSMNQSVGPDGLTFSEAFSRDFGTSRTEGRRAGTDDSATLPLLPDGLLKSRWAMSDPRYAKKYAKGATKIDLPKKIKQAADARFVDESAGWYLSGGVTAIGDTPSPLGSIEIGFTGYHTSYLTNRVGFIAAANHEDYYIGGETGFRLQTPTRLAPFLGLGLFAGASSTRKPAEHDNRDNDDDGLVDEVGETELGFDGALLAIYPETGVHFWWTPRVRFSGFGRYLITTQGRRADDWYFGAAMAILSR